MPHFILDCSDDVLQSIDRHELMQRVFDTANQSGLFDVANIKVRLRPYSDYLSVDRSASFVHVFGYIMGGRTIEQRNQLSQSIVRNLIEALPEVPIISMNVMEFEKATYNNRLSV